MSWPGLGPSLEVSRLTAGYPRTPVVHGVEFRAMPGEHVALVGANGSGKSTLLRTLAGLLEPLAGVVRWGGKPLPGGSERVRAVGVLLQNEVPGPFTVAEQLALGLSWDGPLPGAQRAAIDACLQRTGLFPLANRRCDTLSGGEAQRARFARTTIAEPRLLLLDEPTNHLDPARSAELLDGLRLLPAQTTVVLSTHDLSLAATCDRVVLLHAGRVLVSGAAEEVLLGPALSTALGVSVHAVPDPRGGPPFFRVEAAGRRRTGRSHRSDRVGESPAGEREIC